MNLLSFQYSVNLTVNSNILCSRNFSWDIFLRRFWRLGISRYFVNADVTDFPDTINNKPIVLLLSVWALWWRLKLLGFIEKTTFLSLSRFLSLKVDKKNVQQQNYYKSMFASIFANIFILQFLFATAKAVIHLNVTNNTWLERILIKLKPNV